MAETRKDQNRSGQAQQERGIQRRDEGQGRLRRREPFDVFGFGPFGLMRRMQEDMDRLFGDAWGGGRQWPSFVGEGGRTEWAPAIETFQRGNEFVVRAEVPGLSPDDVSVEIGDDALTIQGERKYEHEEEHEGVFRSERSYGSFCRVVPLPEGAMSDSAQGTFKNGVLEVVLQAPSREVRRGRRIEIRHDEEKKQERK
jgi:HSP20 family protein